MLRENIAELSGMGRERLLPSLERHETSFLFSDLQQLLVSRGEILGRQGKTRPPEVDRFLFATLDTAIAERCYRVKELKSKEAKEAVGIITELSDGIGLFGDLCIDGRTDRTTEFGFIIGIVGGFLRVPAGRLSEFVQSVGPGQVLDKKSEFARTLDAASQAHKIFAEIFDSHVGCAAEEIIQAKSGITPSDGGLRANVLFKKANLEAMRNYLAESGFPSVMYPIQVSFDPHGDHEYDRAPGYMYMGLETNDALTASQDKGYTSEVLQELVKNNKILYSGSFLQDEVISGLFEENYISHFDWEGNFKHTVVSLWRKIKSMKDKGIIEHILNKYVEKVFPSISGKEKELRALLLLANAYNAFHLNKTKKTNDKHREAVVECCKGEGIGTHPLTSSFSVSGTGPELIDHIMLAADIITKNRTSQDGEPPNINDFTGNLSDEAHKKAPIGVLVEEIVEGDLSLANRKTLQQLDFSDLSTRDWMTMTNLEFKDFCLKKWGEMPINVEIALSSLHEKMKLLWRSDSKTYWPLVNGRLEAVPMLVLREGRMPVKIVPFIHRGVESGSYRRR